jgi:hypothetical protein
VVLRSSKSVREKRNRVEKHMKRREFIELDVWHVLSRETAKMQA